MFRTKYIILSAVIAAAAACTRPTETGCPEVETEAEPASLTIDFSAADLDIDVETRTSDLEKWLNPEYEPTPEEAEQAERAAIIDGNKMSCLTVFLIHKKNNNIVAYREIKQGAAALDSQNGFIDDATGEVNTALKYGSRARVTFDYDNPKHKDETTGESAERLLRGEYRLFAVANYDHTIITDNNSNVQQTLEGIKKKFHDDPVNGIGNFNPDYEFFYNIRFLLNRTIGADGKIEPRDKDYIRPAVNQSLSATQNVFLAAGENHISAKLLRISSRTRVEVKNYGSTKLHVHNLSFSDNYTQSTIYLFRREYHSGNYDELATYNDHDGKGAPDVESDRAILSFNKTNGATVEPNAKKAIFDALMYDSYDAEKPFTYTIEVSYPEVTNYKTRDITKIDTSSEDKYQTVYEDGYVYAIDGTTRYITGFTNNISLYNTIKNNYSSGDTYFLVQGVGSGKYLYEKDDGAICAGAKEISLESDDITSYLWKMKLTRRSGMFGGETGDPRCEEFINVKSSKHMGAIPKGTHDMTSDTKTHSLTLGVDNGGVTFSTGYYDRNTGQTIPYYLNVWGGDTEAYGGALGGYTGLDANSQFRIYPVKLVKIPAYVGSPRMTKTVKLTTFNDDTAVVEDVHEIQRNDFVRILVEVSYNPDKGDFMFEVEPWIKDENGKDKGGEVTFN